MNRHSIALDGHSYQGAGDAPVTELPSRPSQPADAGKMQVAQWEVSGAAFNSNEDVSNGDGYLGVCGPINVDTRWKNEAVLGPLLNVIDLSVYDHKHVTPLLGATPLGTTFILGATPPIIPADGQVEVRANGKRYAYITRGARPAKVELNTMTVKRANVEFDGPALDIVRTRAEDGSADQEVSVALGEGKDYRTLNFGDIGVDLAGDGWGGNDEKRGATVFGIAPDRVVALEDDTVYGNILEGVGASKVTMAEPSWGTVATLSGYDYTFTDFITDGSLWMIGTSIGPFVFDVDLAEFYPLFPESDSDPENARAMTISPQMGVIMGMRDGAYQLSGTSGHAWGAETFAFNTCQIQGYPTAHASTTHRDWQVIRNTSTGHSYLIEWRKRQIGDPHPGHQFLPYPLAKLDSKQSRYLRYIGRLGGVLTHPTLMGGYGSDTFWMQWGETSRDIDDTEYPYAASGTLQLTELRRNPGVIKDWEAFEFTAADASETETITFGMTVDDVAVNSPAFAPVTTNGFKRIDVKALTGEPNVSGIRAKPNFALARTAQDTLKSPKIIGPLRGYYRERPLMLRVFQFPLELTGRGDVRTADDELTELKSLEGKGPVELEGLPISWGRVESVEAQARPDRSGGETGRRGNQHTVLVRVAGWS